MLYTSDTGNEMVLRSSEHLRYKTLCKAFVESGTNPFTSAYLNWSDVPKLILSHHKEEAEDDFSSGTHQEKGTT